MAISSMSLQSQPKCYLFGGTFHDSYSEIHKPSPYLPPSMILSTRALFYFLYTIFSSFSEIILFTKKIDMEPCFLNSPQDNVQWAVKLNRPKTGLNK